MVSVMIERQYIRADALVVGSGAAGLNAAVSLKKQGLKRVVLISSGLNRGTSRNTGSDKQTYYKLGLSSQADSIASMAETLFSGGAMDGPTALAEAALSARGFLHLADIGVPFPQDRYGCFPGYQTDHDPAGRASSCGPYTSRDMTRQLEQEARLWGAELWGGYQAVRLLTADGAVQGVAALNLKALKRKRVELAYFLTRAVVYAVGASAGLYAASVYPASQLGGMGAALMAGAPAVNLTEWQYGIASLHPRWNLSGSYQQIIPRYFSVQEEGGEEYEFLTEVFANPAAMLDAIFLKGYQWPFDAEKTQNSGSSLIDLAVWRQRQLGRKVYLDFRQNPLGLSWAELWGLLGDTARSYLANSHVTGERPVDRLASINAPALALYRDKGRDLSAEPLEIAICAQHQNGGLQVDHWWRSPLEGLYPVGECAGTHGVRRPGGAALNSGQVGSMRAAQWIAAHPMPEHAWDEALQEQAQALEARTLGFLQEGGVSPAACWRRLRTRMEGMDHVRSLERAREIAQSARDALYSLERDMTARSFRELEMAFTVEDLLMTQWAMAASVADYVEAGGGSRGSALIADKTGTLELPWLCCRAANRALDGQVQQVCFRQGNMACHFRTVLPLPQEESWFETAWAQFQAGAIYR